MIPTSVTFPPRGADLQGESVGWRHDRGQPSVDDHSRVSGADRVCAIGDETGVAEPKRAITGEARTKVAPADIQALLNAPTGASPALRRYAPITRDAIVVPIGPAGGAGHLPLPPNALVVGPFLTRQITGKELLIGRYRKKLGPIVAGTACHRSPTSEAEPATSSSPHIDAGARLVQER